MKHAVRKIKLGVAALVALILAAITQAGAAGALTGSAPDLAPGGLVDAVFETLGFMGGPTIPLEAEPGIDPGLSEGSTFWVSNQVDGPLDHYELEFRGSVEVIADGYWVVHGLEIRITPHTVIVGQIHVGNWVKVTAGFGEGDQLVAKRIELTGDWTRDVFVFRGIVESIGEPIWTITGHEVIVTPDTEIVGTIEVGYFVKVHAIFAGTDRFIALRIERTEPPGDHVVDRPQNLVNDNDEMSDTDRSDVTGQDAPSDAGSDGNHDTDQNPNAEQDHEIVDPS
jgi:hypothetical protein